MATNPQLEVIPGVKPPTDEVIRHLSAVSDPDVLEQEVDDLEQEIHPLLEAALAIEVELGEFRTQECPADGEDYDYNVTLGPRDGGRPFGAAGVYYPENLIKRNGSRISTAEIEVFHVDHENRMPAYLALLLGLINTDPDLRLIDGPTDRMATGENMVNLAANVEPFLLELGWQIKYKLLQNHHPSGRPDTIETFDQEDLRDLDGGVQVTHCFQKTSTPKITSSHQRDNQLH